MRAPAPASAALPAPLRKASRLLQRLASGVSSEYDVVEENRFSNIGEEDPHDDGDGDLQDVSFDDDAPVKKPAPSGGLHNLDIESSFALPDGEGADPAAQGRRKQLRMVMAAGAILILAAVGLGGFYLARLTDADRDPAYLAWKEQYHVEYDTREENIRRYEIFVETKALVDTFNLAVTVNGSTLRLATNKFAALDNEELAAHRGHNPTVEALSIADILDLAGGGGDGGGSGGRRLLFSTAAGEETHGRSLLQTSTSLDWVALGKLAPVVNQGCVGRLLTCVLAARKDVRGHTSLTDTTLYHPGAAGAATSLLQSPSLRPPPQSPSAALPCRCRSSSRSTAARTGATAATHTG